jgi:hypothetical protein
MEKFLVVTIGSRRPSDLRVFASASASIASLQNRTSSALGDPPKWSARVCSGSIASF